MKHALSRRTFMMTSATFGLSAGVASAGIFDGIVDAVTGHYEDAKGRVFGENEVIVGNTFKTGMFDETAVGQDAAHWAKGTASVIKNENGTYIQLGLDFNSGPLPDGYVYYSKDTDINDEADFNSTRQVEVGPLKLGKGASAYKIPDDAEINSVTIWCKRFGAYIGSADVVR